MSIQYSDKVYIAIHSKNYQLKSLPTIVSSKGRMLYKIEPIVINAFTVFLLLFRLSFQLLIRRNVSKYVVQITGNVLGYGVRLQWPNGYVRQVLLFPNLQLLKYNHTAFLINSKFGASLFSAKLSSATGEFLMNLNYIYNSEIE